MQNINFIFSHFPNPNRLFKTLLYALTLNVYHDTSCEFCQFPFCWLCTNRIYKKKIIFHNTNARIFLLVSSKCHISWSLSKILLMLYFKFSQWESQKSADSWKAYNFGGSKIAQDSWLYMYKLKKSHNCPCSKYWLLKQYQNLIRYILLWIF